MTKVRGMGRFIPNEGYEGSAGDKLEDAAGKRKRLFSTPKARSAPPSFPKAKFPGEGARPDERPMKAAPKRFPPKRY